MSFATAFIAKKEYILKKEIETPLYLQIPQILQDLDTDIASNYVKSAISTSSMVESRSRLVLEFIFLFYIQK